MQTSYSNIEQGDIVIVQVPYSDESDIKRRPTLVVSSSFYNKKSKDIIVASITSKTNYTSYDISLTSNNLKEGRLKLQSYVRADHPTTIYKPRVERKIGKVALEKLSEVKQKMRELYEL